MSLNLKMKLLHGEKLCLISVKKRILNEKFYTLIYLRRIIRLIIKNCCVLIILCKESKNLTEDMKNAKQDVDPAVVKDMNRLTKRMTKLQQEMEGDKISDDAFKVI